MRKILWDNVIDVEARTVPPKAKIKGRNLSLMFKFVAFLFGLVIGLKLPIFDGEPACVNEQGSDSEGVVQYAWRECR